MSKNDIFLPKTKLPMRASLVESEKHTFESWASDEYISEFLRRMQGREVFNLIDGPPYANGDIHLGHALNKILKDVIVRSMLLEGYVSYCTPIWDCHGLPIELAMEKADIKKDGNRVAYTESCRNYANTQIAIQKNSFCKLGLLAHWSAARNTMDSAFTKMQLRLLATIADKKLLEVSLKPIHWCIHCGTSLSVSEIETMKGQKHSLLVRFHLVVNPSLFRLKASPCVDHIYILVWTTTPWTLSENMALAVNGDVNYVYVEEGNEGLLMSEYYYNQHTEKYASHKFIGTLLGKDISGYKARKPLNPTSFSTIYESSFVVSTTGTGCVHISPAYGEDDFNLAKKHNIEFNTAVDVNGYFKQDHFLFAGRRINEVTQDVIDLLEHHQCLEHYESYEDKIEVCWRHKIPVIYMLSQQIYLQIKHQSLQDYYSGMHNNISGNPDKSVAELQNMCLKRESWCLSRQRAWGVPMCMFTHKITRELHPNTGDIIRQILLQVDRHIEHEYSSIKDTYLHSIVPHYEYYDAVECVLDVWFDSSCVIPAMLGTTQSHVVCEGRDQYRGWFQHSVITSFLCNGQSPYKHMLTHGYVVDKHGNKMSKSLGNGITPQDLTGRYGTDVVRLWTASVDYTNDIAVSTETLDLIDRKSVV